MGASLKNLNNPRPQWAKAVARTAMYLSTAISILSASLGESTVAIISISLNAVCYFVTELYGETPNQDEPKTT